MKHYWGLVVVIILLLVGCLSGLNYIMDTAEDIAQDFPQLSHAIQQENWEKAQKIYDESLTKWQKVSKIWPMLINHDDMRDIEISFIDFGVIIKEQDQKLALKEMANLSFYLEHVPKNEKITVQNIL